MRNILFATVAVLGLVSATTAMADEFGGPNDTRDQQQVGAYLDRQATDAQLADPTARDSIRSHGRP